MALKLAVTAFASLVYMFGHYDRIDLIYFCY